MPHEFEPRQLDFAPATAAKGEFTLREQLDVLGSFAPVFERQDCVFGHWVEPPVEDGIHQMPYFNLSETGSRFFHMAYDYGWVRDFGWVTWKDSAEGQLFRDIAAVEHADVEQLSKILTVCIRQDRFGEGILGEHFESGLLLAVARRAQALAEECLT